MDNHAPLESGGLWAQTKAMMGAHWNLIYVKQGIGWAIGPIINAVILWYISTLFACKDLTLVEEAYCKGQANFFMPYMLMMVIPNGIEMNMKFVVSQLVEDKEKKVRETLKIMGLGQLAYALAFLLLQACFALICAGIMSGGFIMNEVYFPEDTEAKSGKAFLVTFLLFMANIPFAMALSTMFSSAKVASDMAPLMVLVPVIFLLLILQTDSPVKWLIYPFCAFPMVPPILVLIRYSYVEPQDFSTLFVTPITYRTAQFETDSQEGNWLGVATQLFTYDSSQGDNDGQVTYREVAKALMWEFSIDEYNDREIDQIVSGIERTCYIQPESDYITEAQLSGCLTQDGLWDVVLGWVQSRPVPYADIGVIWDDFMTAQADTLDGDEDGAISAEEFYGSLELNFGFEMSQWTQEVEDGFKEDIIVKCTPYMADPNVGFTSAELEDCLDIVNEGQWVWNEVSMFTAISRAGLQQVNFDIFALLYVPEWIAWVLLILQVPFWFSLYLWLEEVMPSEYGVQRHPCFCLGCGKSKEEEQRRTDEEAHLVADEIYSPDDPIRLEYLTKRFGKLTAVNKLRFSIKEGEIFTILGHNGAGKTTAIYMLTGVLKASEGDAVVYGHRISTEMAEVQRSIGLCQQFDVLFDEMTCRQHLVMICRIKDMDPEMMEKYIEETLENVMLKEHADKKVTELSGGMKRKLSLAMAIVTKPKVIILDEPTSGLDVESRRQVWALIKKIKQGRSIIMSSQHLEEADELADRIAIMTKGQLLALDTPNEIKRRFGFGYKILIEPNNCSPTEFADLKQSVIDPILLSEENLNQGIAESQDSTKKKLIYEVPFTQVQTMSAVLKILEQRILGKAFLDIEMNSLEDAYLNIAKEEEKLLQQMQKVNLTDQSSNKVYPQSKGGDMELMGLPTPIEDKSGAEEMDSAQRRKEPDLNAIDPKDLERYLNTPRTQSTCRQVWANFKRRILQFTSNQDEQLIIINPLIFLLINMVVIKIILDAMGKVFNAGKEFDEIKENINSIIFAVFMMLAYNFAAGMFVITILADRFGGLRYQLNFTGIRSVAYILGIFLSDYVLIAVLGLCECIIGTLVGQSYRNFFLQYFVALLMFSGPFILLNQIFAYPLAWWYQNSPQSGMDNGHLYVLIPNILLFTAGTIIRGVTEFEFITYLVPYTGCYASLAQITASSLEGKGAGDIWREIGPILLSHFVQMVVLFPFAVILDYMKSVDYRGKDMVKTFTERPMLDEGEDVIAHREQAKLNWSQSDSGCQIEANELEKIYRTTKGGLFECYKRPYEEVGVQAVAKNTFSIAKGEVFGLLGPNGAGKSSTFNLLAMANQRSDGECRVAGTDMDKLDVWGQNIIMGMCPQHNTFAEHLTVQQMLRFMGEIKGLSEEDLIFHSDFIKETMDLGEFSDTKAKNLSGGNKRKLVCAMSLIGYPLIEFLDEPTTGVDPVSARSLFRLLKSLKNSSMVLTTHRMDEAESLCDNIVIQVNGRFVCYGSPGQLKHTYGKGYSIVLKHMKSEKAALAQAIANKCPYFKKSEVQKGATEEGEEDDGLPVETAYKIEEDINSSAVGGLSNLFLVLIALKQEKLILDYTVSRASLEQVFIEFAQHQHNMEDEEEKAKEKEKKEKAEANKK